ncbi:hypothetical protein NIES2119_03080 [[Phormidium ambiguum] IAM M-71]|uniref:Uncharacterized protein n=1 Tax=[Phormidium ambiguum] IAM M-71 TaxID=454136 RepID=A0A1U7IRE0_9CYAN|nr:hypothetical protein [Phormidium ambiguum]OKH39953.1 hypothetical protein NIES2119_03080 [Phormidium ambiguum IAM M-71]
MQLLVKSSGKNLIFWLFLLLFSFNLQPVKAQYQERFQRRIQQEICPKPITQNDISQANFTPPSIWWAAERFGGMILDFWFTCPAENRVYLIVNRQIWNSLNYVERYSFVNHFGTYSRLDKYNVEVLNPQLETLAAYRCVYTVNPLNCNLWVESFGNYAPPPLRSPKPKP